MSVILTKKKNNNHIYYIVVFVTVLLSNLFYRVKTVSPDFRYRHFRVRGGSNGKAAAEETIYKPVGVRRLGPRS